MCEKKTDGIYRGMWWTNLLLHPWRNNPRTVNKYYFRVIYFLENKLKTQNENGTKKAIDPRFQKELQMSKASFDGLFGLVKVLRKDYELVFVDIKEPEKKSE